MLATEVYFILHPSAFCLLPSAFILEVVGA